PFFSGGACALAAMRLRSSLEDTGEFTRTLNARDKRGTRAELSKHPRAVLTVGGLTMGGTIAFYTYSLYMQTFLVHTVGMSKHDATLVSAAS
ncbi:alpha-ketoglutarate permease, partial [Burkholderia pseudomallei]